MMHPHTVVACTHYPVWCSKNRFAFSSRFWFKAPSVDLRTRRFYWSSSVQSSPWTVFQEQSGKGPEGKALISHGFHDGTHLALPLCLLGGYQWRSGPIVPSAIPWDAGCQLAPATFSFRSANSHVVGAQTTLPSLIDI